VCPTSYYYEIASCLSRQPFWVLNCCKKGTNVSFYTPVSPIRALLYLSFFWRRLERNCLFINSILFCFVCSKGAYVLLLKYLLAIRLFLPIRRCRCLLRSAGRTTTTQGIHFWARPIPFLFLVVLNLEHVQQHPFLRFLLTYFLCLFLSQSSKHTAVSRSTLVRQLRPLCPLAALCCPGGVREQQIGGSLVCTTTMRTPPVYCIELAGGLVMVLLPPT